MSWKVEMKSRWPTASRLLGRAYRATLGQVRAEISVVRQVGVRRLWKEYFPSRPAGAWESVLPLQRPSRVQIEGLRVREWTDFLPHLEAQGLPWGEGMHALYLPPQSWRGGPFRDAALGYPADSALKLSKSPGGAEESTYVFGDTWSTLQKRLTSNHRRLTLVANLLYAEEIGPRLYDLIEFECENSLWTGYVVQHVEGRNPTEEEGREGIGRLRKLESAGDLTLATPNGFDHADFQPPTCNGNALISAASGRFQYVDFQNVILGDYESRLDRLAIQAQEDTHFGQRSFLRGGTYLYQSVPGTTLPAKRDTAYRTEKIRGLLEEAGVAVEGRLVLDVGCNIGMMIAHYLRDGARWCVGWDRPTTVPHTASLLNTLGCTRYSLHGSALSSSYPIDKDIDDVLTRELDGCVISFLAMHAHVGWLEAFGRIPWAFMIYEGHEEESLEVVSGYLDELRNLVAFEVSAMTVYEDGACRPRVIAILTRNQLLERRKPAAFAGEASRAQISS